MPRTLITTVGTSLLTNRDGRPWGGWRSGSPFPEPKEVEQWLESTEPAQASAETNTWQAIGLEPDDRVALLHSDTAEGRYCAERLLGYLQAGRCRQAHLAPLGGLGYHPGTFAQCGLRSLVSAAVSHIVQARRGGLEPILCATGGFKAEAAFLCLLGALLQVEVYYIHEQFREIVRLPRLPLEWDAAFVEQHRPFFEWIDAEPRTSVEVEHWLQGRSELRPLVEDASDGHTYLNAAGNLLWQAARERLVLEAPVTWPPVSERAPREKNGLSGTPHHRPRGWEHIVQRLCEIDCVVWVRYGDAASGGPAVRVLDPRAGIVALRYTAGGRELPLVVETTARGQAQTELVANYLRRRIATQGPGA